jgi:hypothetical protein
MDDTHQQFLPEFQSIRSDAEYMKYLRRCILDVEQRKYQAAEAIPALEREIQEVEESRKASSAALATLRSTLGRVSALVVISPQNEFVQGHLPPPIARSSASHTLAEFTAYHSTISEKLNSLRRSLETARVAAHSSGAHHKRLQNAFDATAKAIEAKYKLVHPIHRLPYFLLTRIFALVVSEEYTAAASTITLGREALPLVSPNSLSLVCHHWRGLAYSTESLWNRVLVTAQSPPSPFRTTEAEKPSFVLAVEGNTSPQENKGSLIARHIESLASRTSIRELTYSGEAFKLVQECILTLPHLTRLSLTYTKSKSDPVIIALSGSLESLTYLSCIGAYPSFTSTLPALETLEMIVRHKGEEKPPPLDSLLAKAPNLKSLMLFRTPDLEVGTDVEHRSLTSIKVDVEPLADALREGRLSLPNLSSLDLYITSWDILLRCEKIFAPGCWTSQILTLRLEFPNRLARSEDPEGLHKLLAPFSSLQSLLIIGEDRPELLLSASRQALIPKLSHIKVENSACDGVALLTEVKAYNNRQEALGGEPGRLTHVELVNCPNVVAGVMKQLRMLTGVEHPVPCKGQKQEGSVPLSAGPPRAPTPLSGVVPEGPPRAPRPVEANIRLNDKKNPPQELPVRDDVTGCSSPQHPTSLQLETSVSPVRERPNAAVQVPEVPRTPQATPPNVLLPRLPPRPQRSQPERPDTPTRKQKQWSGFVL